MQKVRNSNVELLRIVIMAFIVIHHCLVHGLGLTNICYGDLPEHVHSDNGVMISFAVDSICIVAVNVFVLISGYFGIRISNEKVISLIFQMLFYTILFSTVPIVLAGGSISQICYSLMFVSKSPYWFMVVYLMLMTLAPMMNVYLKQLSKKKYRMFILILLFFTSYVGFFWEHSSTNVNGYNIFQFITLYAIGGYLNRFGVQLMFWKAILLFVFFSICTWLCEYVFYVNDKNFLYWTHLHMSWKFTNYNSPFIIGASVCLLLAFLNLDFSSKTINTISKSALAVYLIQESFLKNYVYSQMGVFAESHSMISYLLLSLAMVLLYFGMACIIDPIQRWCRDKFLLIAKIINK